MTKKQYKKTEKNIFIDKDKNGKDRGWKERKLENIDLGVRLQTLGYRSFINTYRCSELLMFKKNSEGILKLHQTWFCKNKLCSICNWRRSMKYSYQAMEIVDEAMKREPKGRFLFLTLTIKNVQGEQLNQTLSSMTKYFKRLFERKKVKKNLIGFLRATEVTYNNVDCTYHPHFHILLFVKSSYFTGDGENYISKDEWTAMWKQSARLEYDPIVDIRVVKPNKKKGITDVRAAVLETAKYPIKPIGKMGITEEEKTQIIDELMIGLFRKRQIAFGGLFKNIRKELQLDDVENGNLIQVNDEDDKEKFNSEDIIAVWNWERKNYFISNFD